MLNAQTSEKKQDQTLVYFLAAIGLQSVLLFVGPAQRAYTYLTGTPATLKTVPVDPYDPVRGYSVTLNYDISSPLTVPGVSPLSSSGFHEGQIVYVTLQKPTGNTAWTVVRYQSERPKNLPADQLFLQGTFHNNRIRYGIETYYVPEEKIQEVNQAILKHPKDNLVDVRIDAAGKAIPVQLRIAGKVYAY
ncbi:MAG: GDYXXLXY domain-containing protein [Anaerolineae bacterium]|nr:GDYXXLXY domain-containing protein [Gloeobacterales cyanobacterium ES-bin-313]